MLSFVYSAYDVANPPGTNEDRFSSFSNSPMDGCPDIFVACDSTASLLLMNNRDGTFPKH